MKNYSYILLLVLGFSSCADDFVETTSERDIQGVENQIIDIQSATAAVNGMYNDLQDADLYNGTMNYFLGMWADELVHSGSFPTFAQVSGNDPNSENVTNGNMWDAFYNVIFAANNLINNLPNDLSGATPDDLNAIRGQGFGVRALMYFNLVRIYGAVPLELEANTTSPALDAASALPRSGVNNVYVQILSDIQMALSLLEGRLDRSTTNFSTAAALTLQGQVALELNDLTTAQTALERVMGLGFGLDTIENLYGNADRGCTLSGVETIFGVPFSATDGGGLAFFFSDQPDGGRDEVRIGAALTNASVLEPTDLRFQSLISPSGIERIAKYTQPGNGDDDIHVFRYADVLLMLAEVYARQNDARAVDLLNQVRIRAGAAPVASLDSSNFMDVIANERLIEFFAETGDRYHTLKRFGLLDDVVQAKPSSAFVAERQNLFPIPQNELDNNDALSSADQNPGY